MRLVQGQRSQRHEGSEDSVARADRSGLWGRVAEIFLAVLVLLAISGVVKGQAVNESAQGLKKAPVAQEGAENEEQAYSELEAESEEAKAQERPSLVAMPASRPSRPSALSTRSSASSPGHGPSEEIEIDLPGYRREVDALLMASSEDPNTQREADALYSRLSHDLWAYRAQVRGAIASRSPQSLAYSTRMIAIYDQRDRLLFLVSPDLLQRIQGAGPLGRSELKNEARYVETRGWAQLRVLQHGSTQIIDNLDDSPIGTLWIVIEIALVLMVFRGLRRWVAHGFADLRKRLLSTRPRSSTNLQLARIFWYLDRTGSSILWLGLVVVLSILVRPTGFDELSSGIYLILLWIFVAKLLIDFFDAVASRSVGGRRSDRVALRMRSLRLVGSWAVLLGLGFSLIERYAGHGALYGWFARSTRILTVLVVLLLIRWWRQEINERLERQSLESESAARLLAHAKGWMGYPMTVVGAVYLVAHSIKRGAIRWFSSFEFGRRVLAVLVRREVEKDQAREQVNPGEPLDETERSQLVNPGERLPISNVAVEEFDRLHASIASGLGGGYVVAGDRGVGKTTFFEHLAGSFEGTVPLLDCPPGGFQGLIDRLGETLGLSGSDRTEDLVTEALDSSEITLIIIDNAHRLVRPWMGGQIGLEQLIQLDARLERPVAWVLGVEKLAWRYIQRAQAERSLVQQGMTLPTWTEEQIGKLVGDRAESAGMQLDYSRLILPRQLDSGEHDSVNERNQFGYARVLWEMSDGIPEVAIRMFADSLRRTPEGVYRVQLPQAPFSMTLSESNVDTLLALRVVVRCEVAQPVDIARSLRLGPPAVAALLRFCEQNGWLQETPKGWIIPWKWYRAVTRILMRKNLVVR